MLTLFQYQVIIGDKTYDAGCMDYKDGLPIILIAGCCGGGVFLLIVLAVGIRWYRRRNPSEYRQPVYKPDRNSNYMDNDQLTVKRGSDCYDHFVNRGLGDQLEDRRFHVSDFATGADI